jgi:uncharacterized protein
VISAILDTNVLVQSVLGSPSSASSRVLDAYYDGRFRLAYSPDTLEEVIDVLLVPHISRRHGMSQEEIALFVASLLVRADGFSGDRPAAASIPRDLTDTKLLSLAQESHADYLVTNDRRHLLRLGSFGRTEIITPARFLRCLP